MKTEFEKYAREQFDGHEVEVDTDALWTNVYPHVKKEKNNRKLIWFFLFGVLAGIATLSLFIYQNKAIDTNDLIEFSTTSSKDITEYKHKIDHNNLQNQSTPLSLDAATNTSANAIPETDNTFTNLKSTTNLTTTNNTNSKHNSNSTIITTTPLATPPTIATSINRNTKNETKTANVTNTRIPVTTKQAQTTISKKSIASKIENLSIKISAAATNLVLINTLKPIPINQNDAFRIPEFKQENLLDISEEDLSRPKKFTKNFKLSLGIYGGFSKSTTNFSSNDSIGAIYAVERNLSEKRLETLHLGFDISVYKNNFHLRTGAEYTRIASVFNANSSLITSDTIQGIKEIIVNTVTGAIDTITGPIGVTTTTEFTKKHYNYIHLIDIPVIFGYQWEFAPWSIGLEAGIYANISAKYTGEISSTANDAFYNLKKDENSWFKTNIGIQPYIGFNAAYNLSDNLQIHFSPGFRFETIFSTDKNLLREKHAILGLRAGVRYIFD